MKIITGTAKGKTLKTLPTDATRPTSERIKEAMFSSIQFDIEGRRVLDLFAGSGQLGLEALSRGAEHCTFIDSSREAIDIVKANIDHTGFGKVSKTLVSDAANYVRKASGKSLFDLVFIDPPYADNKCSEMLSKLIRAGVLANGALIVVESGEENIDPGAFPELEVTKSKSYGKKTSLNIFIYRKPEA
ncbi:MAG: 16S rRNA (guanine(966)-N(2))-methyltransferase RsmD [Clostridia bacterium]|nr:16S rRNA (guanine(966)-N(2))-methyltransferase RsmD [Clostridia bacterium]